MISKKELIIIGIILIVSTSLVYAEQITQEDIINQIAGITPDSGLYGLDKLFDNIGIVLTRNNIDKINKILKISEERLAESIKMARENKITYSNIALIERENTFNKINEIELNSEEKVESQLPIQKHILILERVRETIPEVSNNNLNNAIISSSKVLEINQINIPKESIVTKEMAGTSVKLEEQRISTQGIIIVKPSPLISPPRVCSTVCVEMWELNIVSKLPITYKCVYDACDFGCGMGTPLKFKTEQECILKGEQLKSNEIICKVIPIPVCEEGRLKKVYDINGCVTQVICVKTPPCTMGYSYSYNEGRCIKQCSQGSVPVGDLCRILSPEELCKSSGGSWYSSIQPEGCFIEEGIKICHTQLLESYKTESGFCSCGYRSIGWKEGFGCDYSITLMTTQSIVSSSGSSINLNLLGAL